MKITTQAIADFNTQVSEVMQKTIDGPWKNEPHRVEFKHAGLDCLLLRHPILLHWCGYVGLPEDHLHYGKPYNDVDESVDIHGGLTYSNSCNGHVCHITEGEDQVHWLGFDCAHWQDLSPGMGVGLQKEITEILERSLGGPGKAYKTVDWVQAETKSLAEQLSKL